MKTIQIDEQMLQVGERAGKAEYDKFIQDGIASWHKERTQKELGDGKWQTADNNREPAIAMPPTEK